MKINLIFLFTVSFIVLNSCIPNSQQKNQEVSESVSEVKLAENKEFDESVENEKSIETESKTEQENNIKIVFGENYNYGNKEYPILSTKVYLQIGNGKKVLFPFAVTKDITLEIPENIKANFEPEEVDKSTKPEFEFYYTRFNRSFAFMGIKKENKLFIYRKDITFEDEVRAENGDNINEYIFFELVAEYNINKTDLKLLYSRDDNHYTNEYKQDFFEPISYSKEEIIEFIISKYRNTFTSSSANYFTKRFLDFQRDVAYYYEEGLTLGQRRQIEDKYKAVYNLEAWKDDIIEYSFLCPHIDYGHLPNPKVKGEIKEEKKQGKFYSGILYITIVGLGEESYSCKKNIRLVQVNGLLYFDYMKEFM